MTGKGLLQSRIVPQPGKPNKIAYSMTYQGRTAMDRWVYEETRLQEAKDDLFVKLYNLSIDNVSHMIGEVEQRREQVMQKLYLYEKIKRVHYQNPESLPLRRKGVYLALDWGIQQGEQFLQWSDGALELLATVENSGRE